MKKGGIGMTRWHLLFSGRVQAVGFRYWARRIAEDLGLTGWVENLDDGRVEAEVQGEPPALRQFLLRLKAKPYIRLTGVELTELPPAAHERGFRVRGLGF